MYWPIGAPDVYALSKQAAILPTPTDDGIGRLDSGEQALRNGTPLSLQNNSKAPASVNNGNNGNDHPESGDLGSHGTEKAILAMKVSRGGSIFATITSSCLTIWQTKPAVVLAAIVRSAKSLKAYGASTALLIRPDGLIIVVQTDLGFLITYTLATDPQAIVYQTQLPASTKHSRQDSVDGHTNYRRPAGTASSFGPGEQGGIREVKLRFRMVIRIDAGISKALALDDELVVATQKPAAIQCIRWVAENGSPQTSTELLSKMSWLKCKPAIIEMVHDKPMNLSCWISKEGKAYAVQRNSPKVDPEDSRELFHGFCFRESEAGNPAAIKLAINARFSLIAVGCTNGNIEVYVVKDYTGNIPLSHTLHLSPSASGHGKLSFLSYSPDGYCLFAGYEKGWVMWSVYGKMGASSFAADHALCEDNDDRFLTSVRDAFWIGGGCELAILSNYDDRLWLFDVARNAALSCMQPSNMFQGLIQSSKSVMLYRGHDVSDLTSLPGDSTLWQTIQFPNAYLTRHWPIKSVAVSVDGKYLAVAGRRGFAHYSVTSGRWKTFDDQDVESKFAIRGGMCWHQHFLIAAVEIEGRHQLRIFSREKALERILYSEELDAPAILTTTSGGDSLLVYTNDNILLHYIIAPMGSFIKLVRVGQIGFHGIIRAPLRVRAISWILPDDQLEHGDPAQDVATASVIFLVDGKLVLLQPSMNELGELKYDMRVIAQNVEYYLLMRDQVGAVTALNTSNAYHGQMNGTTALGPLGHSLQDSLWYYDGEAYHIWSDVLDVLATAPAELGRDLPPTVRVPVDFAPISTMIAKGVVHGLDPELVQRRDVNFSFFKLASRTQLFLPQLLRHHLAEYNSPAALHLASTYQHLPYFAHALEILLHDVLDSEVDKPPSPPETALLPTVISFLSSFTTFLDIIVNCTRKTELRSWRTLFSYLPPVRQLFEESLAFNKLKTAAGYLLVLHTFEQDQFQVHEFAQLIRQAAAEQDWELCAELARFLVGIDSTGRTLSSALAETGLQDTHNWSTDLATANGSPPDVVQLFEVFPSAEDTGRPRVAALDYFSARQRG